MGDDDKTRQVERKKKDDDEVFEVGDSAILDASSARHRIERRSSPVPWVLALLAAAGAAAIYLLMFIPAQAQVASEQKKQEDLRAKIATLEEDKKKLNDELKSTASEVAKKDEQLKELEGTKEELEGKLKEEISRGDVLIKQAGGELVVDLADQILFASGEADVGDKGKEVLKRVGETMLKVEGKVIQVGGHTDDQPLSDKLKAKWASNWELSANRALNVVHFLEDEVKVPGERLVAAGFSQYRPVAKNKTKEGRKKNRRIEVILLPLKKK